MDQIALPENQYNLSDLAYAYGKPSLRANIRVHAEDFKVSENINFTPTGQGEHVLLQLCKRHANTEWVVRQLANFAKVKPGHIGYAGLKDRHAETTQWFSVHLPGKNTLDWNLLAIPDVTVLQITKHQRKLQRGSLKSNSFEITLRDLQSDSLELAQRLELIQNKGVPNYFGEQRFGHEANNLANASALFAGADYKINKHQRGLYLSAARSWLFNQVLSHRIQLGNWNSIVAGDVMMLNGSHSIFKVDNIDQVLLDRVVQSDIHPTGPLWGKGASLSQLEAKTIEDQALEHYADWKTGLEKFDLMQERRSFRVIPQEFSWQSGEDNTLILRFHLPAGCYATAILRELIHS